MRAQDVRPKLHPKNMRTTHFTVEERPGRCVGTALDSSDPLAYHRPVLAPDLSFRRHRFHPLHVKSENELKQVGHRNTVHTYSKSK